MGILPLKFMEGQNAESIGLKGDEIYQIEGLSDGLTPKEELTVKAKRFDETVLEFKVIAQLNTEVEVNYYRNGGILHTVLRNLVK
jgi:aconitate hydratase